MSGKMAILPGRTSFGTVGTPGGGLCSPACRFRGTPPSAIVYADAEFIREMSDDTASLR